MKAAGFTRAALPDAMVYEPLADRTEFAQIITRLVHYNLHAVPAADMPMHEITARFSEWTDKEWFLIRTMARVADTCLGKRRGDEKRPFTRNVLECIEQTWVKRT
jgi:DICT domain-containing protein